MTGDRAITIYRAAILNPQDSQSWEYWRDGACAVQNAHILACGNAPAILQRYPNAQIEELEGVLVPGFVDLHCHWVQHAVQGAYSGELLQWLQEHIWPEEGRFTDENRARNHARTFYADMLRAGTVMGMSFSSVHIGATKIAITEMRGDWIIGNALMAVNAPEYLTKHSGHEQKVLQNVMGEIDRKHYAVTPRFAPNMREKDLQVAGKIAYDHGLFVQTHLAESRAETRWVKELFPEAESYTDVYDRAGLLGPRSILAHAIEMTDAEWRCLASRGAWVAHCPSSNEALDNARMPLEKLRQFTIPWALASDIGGGPSHSMLHVLQRFFALHEKAGVRVSPEEGLFRATLAGAHAMGRMDVAGNFMPGKRADFILMPEKPHPGHVEAWFRDLCRGEPADLEVRPLATWLGGERIQMLGEL